MVVQPLRERSNIGIYCFLSTFGGVEVQAESTAGSIDSVNDDGCRLAGAVPGQIAFVPLRIVAAGVAGNAYPCLAADAMRELSPQSVGICGGLERRLI